MIRTNQLEKVKYLLEWGINPLSSNDDKQNSLHFTIRTERTTILILLLTGYELDENENFLDVGLSFTVKTFVISA